MPSNRVELTSVPESLAGLNNFSRQTNGWKGDNRQEGVTHGIIINRVTGSTQELVDENQEVVSHWSGRPRLASRSGRLRAKVRSRAKIVAMVLSKQDSVNRRTRRASSGSSEIPCTLDKPRPWSPSENVNRGYRERQGLGEKFGMNRCLMYLLHN